MLAANDTPPYPTIELSERVGHPGLSEGFEEGLELGGEWGFEVHGFAGLGVGEGEAGGVEEVAVEGEGGVGIEGVGGVVGGAVEVVADYGMAEGLHVDADLVGTAGFDFDFDEGEGAVR